MWKTNIYQMHKKHPEMVQILEDATFFQRVCRIFVSLYEMANGDTHTHTLPMTNIDRRTTGTVARRLEWVRPTTWVNLSIFYQG